MDPKSETSVEPKDVPYQITTRNHSRSLLNRATRPTRKTQYRKLTTPATTTTTVDQDSFTCTSSPELDRHVDRTTNFDTDDASTDSEEDCARPSGRKMGRKRRIENNNNSYSLSAEQNNNNNKRKVDCFKIETVENESDQEFSSHAKKRSKQNSIANNNNNEDEDKDDVDVESRPEKYRCPVCAREDFASLNIFETHLEDQHPEYEIKCSSCNINFKNHRVLNLHRSMFRHDVGPIRAPRRSNGGCADATTTTTPIRGFKDLTFVDFSSEKFPVIAREACEREIREVDVDDGVRFECSTCGRAFPCAASLDIHARECDVGRGSMSGDGRDEPLDLGRKRRDLFFAQLDLRNTSASDSSDDGSTRDPDTGPTLKLKEYLSVKPEFKHTDMKDLADIESIISVTSSGGLLTQLAAKTAPKTPEDACNEDRTNSDSNQNHTGDEEHQDDFAAEFRRMKLRGEFPCRLCNAVFPNLRALKGHNRTHLTGAGNVGPYRCNMCPHSSGDKAALVRHMRSHNGDRPYECSICNYAFTTKANCERHLRNRHAKVTREEVKRSIIYHPSEDPTNEEIAAKIYSNVRQTTGSGYDAAKDEQTRSILFNSTPTPPMPILNDMTKIRNVARPSSAASDSRYGLQIPDLNELKKYIPTLPVLSTPLDIPVCVIPKPTYSDVPKIGPNSLNVPKIYPEVLNLSNVPDKEQEPLDAVQMPKIHVRRFDDLKRTSIGSDEEAVVSDDERRSSDGRTVGGSGPSNAVETPLSRFRDEYQDPIDLSMDVLDLSKKRRPGRDADRSEDDGESSEAVQDEPKDFSKKTLEGGSSTDTTTTTPTSSDLRFDRTKQFLFAQQLFKGVGTPVPNFPLDFFANMYRKHVPFPNIPTLGINPYYHPTTPHPFLTPTTSPLELQEMQSRFHKEIMRGLQLSGGELIMDQLAHDRYAQTSSFAGLPTPGDSKAELKTPYGLIVKSDEMKPLQIDTGGVVFEHGKIGSPCKTPSNKAAESIIATTPNSVKMVIKNGVLMPKQKQRRYRTERPFSCEHCSARFTLRSNMERHIKQQHPQFWSQRQRSNVAGVPGRKPNTTSKTFFEHQQNQTTYEPIKYEFYAKGHEANVVVDATKRSEVLSATTTTTALQQRLDGEFEKNAEQPTAISDQVKYAILAQQLKQVMRKDDVAISTGKTDDDDEEEIDTLVIDERSQSQESKSADDVCDEKKKLTIEESMLKLKLIQKKLWEHEKERETSRETEPTKRHDDEAQDLVPVSRLLDNASQIPFSEYFRRGGAGDGEEEVTHSEEDEEGLVSASGSASESGGNASGSDGNRSEPESRRTKPSQPETMPKKSTSTPAPQKKKSAYSLAPNRVTCPYCHRKFPWSSSLRRHVLTHTGQKPYKCPHCPLLFTTKSNCDRHLLRKHGNVAKSGQQHETKVVQSSVRREQTTIAATTTTTTTTSASSNFLMRNVPERPFKCSSCPSSTFSTLNNLKKHISFKHAGQSDPGSPRSCDDGAQTRPGSSQYGYESHSSEDERYGSARRKNSSDWETNTDAPTINYPGNVCNSELPFKCHLCDGSYADRQETLDHIKEYHGAEYDLLVSKGALETTSNHHQPSTEHTEPTPRCHGVDLSGKRGEQTDQHASDDHDEHASSSAATMRGKFPDYANRKVICAFCMRRFWSAEDLRRHMRTHNGARPFSCDVCRRRFTLKHSMLRHRKKHNVNATTTSTADKEKDATATTTGVKDDETESERERTTDSGTNDRKSSSEEGEHGSDLIGNLLGIRDRSIIDQVLVSSADDAAKLLGVDKTE